MALDILPGDLLVVGSDEYPIRSVAHWTAHRFGTSSSFALLASVSCSTKRPPSVDEDGLRGDAAANLTGLTCTPLDPVVPEIAERPGTSAPEEVLETFVTDDTDFARLGLEDIKA